MTNPPEMYKLREAIESSWKQDTAYLNAHEDGNPALGQCYPTARVVQHYFPETEIVFGEVWTGKSNEAHYWNTLDVDGIAYHIDLSWRQFPAGSAVKSYKTIAKEDFSTKEATVKRVDLLLERVKNYLNSH